MDDDTYSMSDALVQNNRDKVYIQIFETTNGAKYLVKGNNIVYLSDNGQCKGVIHNKKKMTISQKILQSNKGVYFGEVCN